MARSEREAEYDRIAATRLRVHEGGHPLHLTLGGPSSIRLRWRLRSMGLNLDDEKVKALAEIVDSLNIQATLSNQPLGVRYAASKRKKIKPRVWLPKK